MQKLKSVVFAGILLTSMTNVQTNFEKEVKVAKETKVKESNLTLDTEDPFLVTQPEEKHLKIVVGESEANKAERLAREAREAAEKRKAEEAAAAAARAQAQRGRSLTSVASVKGLSTSYTGDVQGLAHGMIVERWGEGEWPAFKAIIDKESGWNVASQNRRSGACGLAQALPCSKMAAYGPDYRNNPTTQLNFAISYIEGRYGTPSRALAFHRSHNWY